MKKVLFYLAVAAMGFVACTKEIDDPVIDNPANSDTEMVPVSFFVTLENSTDDATKATVNLADGTATWASGDEIAIHTKNGALATLSYNTGTSKFEGTISAGDKILNNAVAYYPASIAIAGDAAHVNMPGSYASAEEAEKSFPLRGLVNTSTNEIALKHMGGLLKITATYFRDEIDQVVVSLPLNITGTLAVAGTAAAPTITPGSGSSAITIDVSALSRTSGTGEASFVIPVLAGTYTGGFSITFKNSTLGIFGEKSTSNNRTFARNHIYKMSSFVVPGYYVSQAFQYADVNYNAANTYAMFKETAVSDWYIAKDITTDTYPNSRFYMLVNGTDASDGATAAASPVCYGATSGEKPNITVGTITAANANTKRNGTTPFNLSAKDTAFGSNVDAYLNPSSAKVLFASSASPVEFEFRTVSFTTDLELPDQDYFLHLWGAAPVTTWSSCPKASVTTIGGLKYYTFSFQKTALINGSYNFIIRHGDSDYRFDFREDNLTVDDSADNYYLFFTSENKEGFHGDGNTNPSYQFTDPADPEGTSKYLVRVGSTNYSNFEWESGLLVAHSIAIASGSDVKISFNGADDDFYGYASASTTFTDGTWYSVTNSSPNAFGVSADGIYDVYFDFVNKRAKVVKVANSNPLKLMFTLPSSKEHVYVYIWDASSNYPAGAWPGTEITGNTETKDAKTYYFYSLPYTDLDRNYKIIINNGDGAGWQTANYGYLYLSHDFGELDFSVDSSDRILLETDENVTLTVNLASELQVSPYFTTWAYLHYWVNGKASFLGWPGQKSNETEVSSSYSFTLPAKHVWGQNLGLILNNKGDAGGDWQSSEGWYGADFSTMKSSYEFNVSSTGAFSQVN